MYNKIDQGDTIFAIARKECGYFNEDYCKKKNLEKNDEKNLD